MWPGNTADVKALLPVIDRLRQRFAIGRICMVADRGMISAETVQGLEERQLDYVLGARERTDTLVRTVVLNDSAPFTPLLIERAKGQTQLFVKEVKVRWQALHRLPQRNRGGKRQEGPRSHCRRLAGSVEAWR